MRRIILITFFVVLCIKGSAQKQFTSELQCVENSKGTNFNRYKVRIDFDEPIKGGQNGKVTITLLEIGSSLRYNIRYLKQTVDQDGAIYWYYIINNESNEMFNIVKFQKFDKPIFNNKYKYCFILSKYNSSALMLYEHSYFSY
jgi:hypothetical protein